MRLAPISFRRSTLVLMAVFVAALVTYLFVRPDPVPPRYSEVVGVTTPPSTEAPAPTPESTRPSTTMGPTTTRVPPPTTATTSTSVVDPGAPTEVPPTEAGGASTTIVGATTTLPSSSSTSSTSSSTTTIAG